MLFYKVSSINMAINLQEFIEWYKKSEVELWDKKWVFREPIMKDLKMNIQDMLKKYCIEWDVNEFFEIVNNQLTRSQQTELIKGVLKELGLV